ncbi:phospholipid-transporting ATPase ABCA3-like [Amblyomma americanum]
MSRQTAAVLWRTLVIQCVRRHFIESAVEVLVVLLLAIAFLSSNFASRPTPESGRLESAPRAAEWPSDPHHGTHDETYAGDYDDNSGDGNDANDGNDDSDIGDDDDIQDPDIRAFYSPETAYAARLIAVAFPTKKAVAFRNESALVKACESVEFELCVHFRGDVNGSDVNETKVLSYTLHFFEDDNPGKKHLDIGFRHPKEFFYEPDLDKPLWGYTYSAQAAINRAHITLQEESSVGKNNITMKPFPRPKFPEDTERYRVGVFWLVAIVFLYPMWRLVTRITFESSQGLREYERLMGLSDCFYWTGQFACSLCFCLVYSAICVYCAAIQKQTTRGVAFLERTDLSLLYAVFAIHSVLQILLTMFVTCVCTNECAALAWVAVLCVAAPYWVLSKLGGLGSLAEFVFRDRFWTLLSSLLPTVASYNLLTIIGIQNDFDGGASWSTASDLALGVVTFTMLDIWTVNLVTACILIFLIFYLTKVLPWNTAIPSHPLFLFNPNYWKRQPTPREPATMPLRFKDKRFEPEPRGLRPVLHIEGLSVTYGNTEALKQISLQAFEKQVTVLVGRNGAGKTTLINVMTGLQKPNEGKVFIYGYDMVRHTSLARTSISYCPQRDMIFPDLTVWEHLLYIGTVQQIPTRQLKAAAEETLVMVNLEGEADVLSQDLKRGEMKRLSIAMAIIAKPKVVLIDEPTSGLDSSNTHSVWDILLHVRGTSTLFVATHDMTEADVLADRVVALTAGIVVCNASPNYLKNLYGVGYKVRLVKRAPFFQKQRVLSIIQQYVPDAEVTSDTPAQVTVALHTVMSGGFDRMFRELEKSSVQLGIRSIGLGVSTLKDIYIKLALASLSLVKSPMATEHQLPADLATVVGSRGHHKPSPWAVFEVIMSQRILFAWRRWPWVLLSVLLPVLIFLAAFHWMSAGVREDEPAPAGVIRLPASLRVYYPSAATFVDADAKAWKGVAPFYHSLVNLYRTAALQSAS